MDMVKAFEINRSLPSGINSSFITLIPKVEASQNASEFRPISLINFTMKILLIAMASRLGKVMRKIISGNQSAFVKGRNISDNILIANKVAIAF